VNKEGTSTGEAKLMFISKEKAELALKELPAQLLGKDVKLSISRSFT
jgi:hypothetical protein